MKNLGSFDFGGLQKEFHLKGHYLVRVKCTELELFRATTGTFIVRCELLVPCNEHHWISYDAWRGILCTGLPDNAAVQIIEKKDLKDQKSLWKMLSRLNIKWIKIKGQVYLPWQKHVCPHKFLRTK